MTNRSIPNSPTRNEQINSELTPAILRRIEREGRVARSHAANAVGRESVASTGAFSVAAMATLALVALGLAAVEAARIALVYSALDSWFGRGGINSLTVLPFAAVLTLALAALDGGLLLRLFLPATAGRNDSWATWAAVGAWLLATTAVTWLGMYALANMFQAEMYLADYAPAAVAVVLLVLRLLLVGALAADSSAVIRGGD